MSFEKEMYEVAPKWEEAYFSDQDRRRIQQIFQQIPEDVNTLLDVGCGNGILVNWISSEQAERFSRVCGVERSHTALQFVRTEKYQAAIQQMPFADREFDCLTCLEVIEHLPLEVFKSGLSELVRIAGKYIIVSVPYREDLRYNRVECKACNTKFSPFYHMRSFDEGRLESLFVDFPQVQFQKHWKIEHHFLPRFKHLRKLVVKMLHPDAFPSNCICPMCGYNQFDLLTASQNTSDKSQASERGLGLGRFWPFYKAPKWIAALYKLAS